MYFLWLLVIASLCRVGLIGLRSCHSGGVSLAFLFSVHYCPGGLVISVGLRLLSSVRWFPLLFPASLLSICHCIRLSRGFFRLVDLRSALLLFSLLCLLFLRCGWAPLRRLQDSGYVLGGSVIILFASLRQ